MTTDKQKLINLAILLQIERLKVNHREMQDTLSNLDNMIAFYGYTPENNIGRQGSYPANPSTK